MADTGKAENKPAKSGGKIDLSSIAGLFAALGGILGGMMMEGGKPRELAQISGSLIVFGGTLGAVLVSTPLAAVMGAARRFVGIFMDKSVPLQVLIDELIGYATKARKSGLVSLEQDADQIADPFLKKAINLAVDGTDLQEIRKMLELEIGLEEHHAEAEAKVFEAAGGFAPTIGIIGAVMGLMQVMKNLANIDEVGHGIAAAFVATIYGVASANLFFLPAANKIKARISAEVHRKELIVEAVSGIVEGLNPKLIRLKLEAYTHAEPVKKSKEKSAPGAAGAAAKAEA